MIRGDQCSENCQDEGRRRLVHLIGCMVCAEAIAAGACGEPRAIRAPHCESLTLKRANQAATRLAKDARVSSTLETVLKIGKISLQ